MVFKPDGYKAYNHLTKKDLEKLAGDYSQRELAAKWRTAFKEVTPVAHGGGKKKKKKTLRDDWSGRIDNGGAPHLVGATIGAVCLRLVVAGIQ